MAKSLADFKIETDTMVWLQFSDGSSRRAKLNLVHKYLSPQDAVKVESSLTLRQEFIQKYIKPLDKLLVIGLLLALLGYGTAKAAQTIWRHYHPATRTPATQTTAVPAVGAAGNVQHAAETTGVSAAPSSTPVAPVASAARIVASPSPSPAATVVVQNVQTTLQPVVQGIQQLARPVLAPVGHVLPGL